MENFLGVKNELLEVKKSRLAINKKYIFLLIVFLVSATATVFAQEANPFQGTFDRVIELITGTGKWVFIILIAIEGIVYAATQGRNGKQALFGTVIGAIIVLGSAKLVELIWVK